MSPADLVIAGAAGALAGAVNAVAGGGTLITFPVLVAIGLPARAANITSSVGLLPGYVGGTVAYRPELTGQGERVRRLGGVAVLGGVAGAVVLLVTPASSFRAVVPYLILISSFLLAGQPRLAAAVQRRRVRRARSDSSGLVQAGVFVSAAYGSYFGAGLGVLLLGVLGILLVDNLQRLNALKGFLSLIVNAVGVTIYAFSGQVAWDLAVVLGLGAWLGGTVGVRIVRHLPPIMLRRAVVALGVVVGGIMIGQG